MRRHQPVLAQPDRRYWRSRQNRKVRKARTMRTLLRLGGLVLANAAIAAILLFVGLRGFQQLTTTDEFALQAFELEGLLRASEQGIRTDLGLYLGRNLLELNLHELETVVRRDPWILQAPAKRILPGTVKFLITERTPTALARVGGRAFIVDREGVVIRAERPDAHSALPLLTGLDGYSNEKLAAALRAGVHLIERLSRVDPDWMDGIRELNLARHDRIGVRTVAPGPEILLDPHRIERNLHQYLALRKEIERRVGSVEYVDLRWADRITVMPIGNVPSGD